MKKEYIAVTIIAMFILSYVIDWLAGPISLSIKNPFHFLKGPTISTYPFTALSIALKTIIIIMSILTLLTLIAEKQLAKGIFLIFLTALLELYPIQAIATGNKLTSLPWSLSLAYSGVLLLVPALIYMVIGLGRVLHRKVTKESYDEVTKNVQDPDI